MSYTIGWTVPKKEQKNVVEQIIETKIDDVNVKITNSIDLDGEKIAEEVKGQSKKRTRKKKAE